MWQRWGRIWQNTIQAFVMGALLVLAASPLAHASSDTKSRAILVFGDSLSAAYNLAPEQGWVHWVGQALSEQGGAWHVRNASVSGETTDGGLRRLPAILDEIKPDVMILELGANDGLRGLPLAQSETNLARMIDLAQAKDIKVLLVGMEIPPNYGPEYTGQFRQMYQSLSAKQSVSLLPFLLAPIADRRENFMDDNLHPTAEAQVQVGKHVLEALKPLL
ncbi:arylesterase [Ahniella affigens]|uniref:Arylesterase n=1 Tax=Ahniella affigens TaxID=2021234 RepID=A0A2P1PYU5_9GAMM|nr:arylesterase [Ahniella affigens]AVQ00018.1 arylesterase [Ahniella affigens]